MPLQRRDAEQAGIVRGCVSSYLGIRQAPGIDAVRAPHLGRFLARFLEAKLLAQFFGLPSLFRLHRGQPPQFDVEPLLAHLQWRKTPIPASLAFADRLDVFDHEGCDGVERAEPAAQPQFPLPSRSRGRRQLFRVAQAMGMRLPAGRLAPAARPAHLAALLGGTLDPIDGVSLEIEVGMGSRDDTVALFLRARVDAHSYRLHLSRRGLDIEPDAEDALLPERGRLATLDPAPCPGRRRRHQGVLLVIDHRDKHRR